MKLFDNVLVTGCGGDIGQGVGRVLKRTGAAQKMIGCDYHDDHPASLFFDALETISRADNADYFDLLRNLV